MMKEEASIEGGRVDGVPEKRGFVSNRNRVECNKIVPGGRKENLCKKLSGGWFEPGTSSPEKTHSIVSRTSESGTIATPFPS